MSAQTQLLVERPLTGFSSFAVLLAAAAMILLFYLFVLGSFLLLVVLVGFELVIMIGLARFGLTLSQLLMLQEAVPDCEAWIATMNGKGVPQPLAKKSFVIFGPSQSDCEKHFAAFLAAMQPGIPPPLPATTNWRRARREQQPAGAVRPGVQGLMN